jgi:Fe-S cluster biosynthesis and repair protein YggX
MNERKVKCKKLGAELTGLEKPPFGGEIGKKIYEQVSAEAWRQWREEVQIKVLNEYRLNLADPQQYAFLVDQMLTFLNLKEGTQVEIDNVQRGKGVK